MATTAINSHKVETAALSRISKLSALNAIHRRAETLALHEIVSLATIAHDNQGTVHLSLEELELLGIA